MKFPNNLRFAICTLLLIYLAACNALPVDQSSPDIHSTATAISLESPTETVNQNWMIVTKEQAEETGIGSWLLKTDDFWMPSEDDILKLEDSLAEYLSKNSYLFYRQPPVWQRLDEYQRQYIGLEREGRQIIYGNYFCNSLGINWQQKLVIVEDGGDCFFQVEYDVEHESFIKLLVNGES